jgi:hypothetical protein
VNYSNFSIPALYKRSSTYKTNLVTGFYQRQFFFVQPIISNFLNRKGYRCSAPIAPSMSLCRLGWLLGDGSAVSNWHRRGWSAV